MKALFLTDGLLVAYQHPCLCLFLFKHTHVFISSEIIHIFYRSKFRMFFNVWTEVKSICKMMTVGKASKSILPCYVQIPYIYGHKSPLQEFENRPHAIRLYKYITMVDIRGFPTFTTLILLRRGGGSSLQVIAGSDMMLSLGKSHSLSEVVRSLSVE